jgi:hypothetical protein
MKSSNYIPLVNLIGVFFQIRDDFMNLQSLEVCFVFIVIYRSEYPGCSIHLIKVLRKT